MRGVTTDKVPCARSALWRTLLDLGAFFTRTLFSNCFCFNPLPHHHFHQPGTAVVYLAPWGGDPAGATPGGPVIGSGDRLALVVAGVDARGLALAARLAAPTIPPMTRAPFTNLVPDWVRAGLCVHVYVA